MNSLIRFALLLFALSLAGCGGGLATVSGTVTLDGQPLKTGNISFVPSGEGTLGQGTIVNGSYSVMSGSVAGLKPGSYRVTVVATEVIPPDPSQPHVEHLPKLLTPAIYGDASTSGLTAEIKAGKNSGVNFELKSTP